MRLTSYQIPESVTRPSLDRWSNLRDDLNTLFESPFWSAFGRAGELFSGWSPALDLYQNTDNIVAVVELPGTREEEIEISLHDGTLTIAGERNKKRKPKRAKSGTQRALRLQIPPQHCVACASGRAQSQRDLSRRHSDGGSAKSGGSKTKTNPSPRRLSVKW